VSGVTVTTWQVTLSSTAMGYH